MTTIYSIGLTEINANSRSELLNDLPFLKVVWRKAKYLFAIELAIQKWEHNTFSSSD